MVPPFPENSNQFPWQLIALWNDMFVFSDLYGSALYHVDIGSREYSLKYIRKYMFVCLLTYFKPFLLVL